jgi:hypothetical protein
VVGQYRPASAEALHNSSHLPDETFLYVFKGAPLRGPPAADRPSGRACGLFGPTRPEPVSRYGPISRSPT